MDKEKLKKWYRKELQRRDEIIKKLKAENLLLLKAALKSSKRLVDKKKKS